jgi:hypothetical protein
MAFSIHEKFTNESLWDELRLNIRERGTEWDEMRHCGRSEFGDSGETKTVRFRDFDGAAVHPRTPEIASTRITY